MIALFVCAVGLLPPAGFAAPPDRELVGQAERAFREGLALGASEQGRLSFARSAEAYEQLARRGYRSPELFRNLGNAAMLAGELPRAILAYRAGLRLAPGDSELHARLADARRQVMGAAGKSTIAAPPPVSTNATFLFWGATGFYTLACAGTVRWLVTMRRAWLMASCVALIGAAACAFFVFEEWRRERYESLHPTAVVARDGVRLRLGNGLHYPVRSGPISRGTEGATLCQRGDWLQIELSAGVAGWIEARDVLQAAW
jgi:hypothetical protein